MRQLPALLCLILCFPAQLGMAQTPIHRCIGANGGAVFSDQPCAALQATPVGTSAQPAPATATTSAPPILCAASVGELRQSIIAAFAKHDANRLAGLMLWEGYSQGSATADIGSLDDLTKQSLLDIGVPDTSGTDRGPATSQSLGGIELDPFGASAAPAPAPATSNHQLVLHTAGNDGPHERRFEMVRRAGCLWLRIAD